VHATEETAGQPAAEYVPLTALRPWEGNPRRNRAAIEPVAKSIREFGFGAPILALRDGEIVAGHTRYEAAAHLKLQTVPVRWLDLPRAKAKALALADNKLGEIAEWDYGMLSNALRSIRDEEGKLLDIIGFDQKEIANLLAAESGDFLNRFDNANDAGGSNGFANTEGRATFAVKLEAEQDQKLQETLLLLKRRGARTNVGALMVMCDLVLVQEKGKADGKGRKGDRRHRKPAPG
jgi:hypothetical protein